MSGGAGVVTKSNYIKCSQELLDVLDVCHDIYKSAEAIYQYLANAHKSSSEIARMWGILAVDKCNHADTFRMAYRLKGQGIRKIHDSGGTARAILAKMKTIQLGKCEPPPSVEAAFRFALKMEEMLAQIHFFQIVEYANDQDGRLLTSSLQSSGSILHMLTEEYVNLTPAESDFFQ